MNQPARTDKPRYSVPLLAQINALEPSGLCVASTFAGCGGSSLGYRMAGFRVLYANEFVEAARDTYDANRRPWTVVDGRDIRDVTADDLMEQIGVERGQLDLLDGSPPCASFSMAGRRNEKWGKVSPYSDTAQRTDDLFYEFARLLEGVQPRAFIAENVTGLVKGIAKGYFQAIHKRLGQAGYRVESRIVDSQWLGVPQSRQRLIFMGVRADQKAEPIFPAPLPYRYSLRDALGWETHAVVAGRDNGTDFVAARPHEVYLDDPAPTLTTAGIHGLNGSSVAIVHEMTDTVGGVGPVYGTEGLPLDPETHESIDLSSSTIGGHWRRMIRSRQSARYMKLRSIDRPIVRTFTLAELRRISSFPDDFTLTGTYAQRWERIGRAVPPLMMKAIAETVRDRVLS